MLWFSTQKNRKGHDEKENTQKKRIGKLINVLKHFKVAILAAGEKRIF